MCPVDRPWCRPIGSRSSPSAGAVGSSGVQASRSPPPRPHAGRGPELLEPVDSPARFDTGPYTAQRRRLGFSGATASLPLPARNASGSTRKNLGAWEHLLSRSPGRYGSSETRGPAAGGTRRLLASNADRPRRPTRDQIAAGPPKPVWQRLSADDGVKGHRYYDRAFVVLPLAADQHGGHHWPLIRRIVTAGRNGSADGVLR